MLQDKLSKETAAPSTIENLQAELKEGGPVLDTLNHQLTQNLFDALSAYNVMTDLDSLYDIIEKCVKTTVGVWVGGSTEPIVSHDALKQAEEQREANPDLDTRSWRNNPDDNLALAGSRNQQDVDRFNKANENVQVVDSTSDSENVKKAETVSKKRATKPVDPEEQK